tara:strand:- start:33 stop:275 length:243 start_codon:yes stop_codon:yes gene_type:complete
LVISGVRGRNLRQLDEAVNQQTGCLTKQKGDPLGIALKNGLIEGSNDENPFEPMPDPASMPHQGCWALLGLTLLEVKAFR